MEKVEDKDDVVAAENATKEQEDVIQEDLKAENTPIKGFEDLENIIIDKSMLPPIFGYGLNIVEGLHEVQFEELDGQIQTEKENEMEEEKEEMSEEEIDYNDIQLDDSEDENITMNRTIVSLSLNFGFIMN